MKNLLKNKLALTLTIVLFVTIILDMFVNGMLQNILTNDTLKTMKNDPSKAIGAIITANSPTYLLSGITVGTKLNVTVEKSTLILFVYGLSLTIGIVQLGLGGTIIFFGLKQEKEKHIKIFILVAGALVLFMAIYGVAAGALKFADGSEKTFVYTISAADAQYINGVKTQWDGTTAGTTINGLIATQVSSHATAPSNAEAMAAEVAKLMGEGMSMAEAQAAAAQNLFGALSAKEVLTAIANPTHPAHAAYGAFTLNAGSIGSYLGYNAGGSFSKNISEWMNNKDYQNTLKWLLSATGLVGTCAMFTSGYALSKIN